MAAFTPDPKKNDPCAAKCGNCVECLSGLPRGASCASSCQHITRCKQLFGQKGNEGHCQWTPSKFTPNIHPMVLYAEQTSG